MGVHIHKCCRRLYSDTRCLSLFDEDWAIFVVGPIPFGSIWHIRCLSEMTSQLIGSINYPHSFGRGGNSWWYKFKWTFFIGKKRLNSDKHWSNRWAHFGLVTLSILCFCQFKLSCLQLSEPYIDPCSSKYLLGQICNLQGINVCLMFFFLPYFQVFISVNG